MKLFSGDNLFTRLMNRIGILAAANLMFVLCCLPVVTMGAGLAALYYTIMRATRENWAINPFSTFWKGLRENFRQATMVFLLLAAVVVILLLEIFWCRQFDSPVGLFRYGLYVLLLATALLAGYLFPVMAAFRCSLPQLLMTSVSFAFRQPAVVLMVILLSGGPIAWTFYTNAYLPLYAFLWCTIGFSGIATLCVKLILPLFAPYLPAPGTAGPQKPLYSEKMTLREMRKLDM